MLRGTQFGITFVFNVFYFISFAALIHRILDEAVYTFLFRAGIFPKCCRSAVYFTVFCCGPRTPHFLHFSALGVASIQHHCHQMFNPFMAASSLYIAELQLTAAKFSPLCLSFVSLYGISSTLIGSAPHLFRIS